MRGRTTFWKRIEPRSAGGEGTPAQLLLVLSETSGVCSMCVHYLAHYLALSARASLFGVAVAGGEKHPHYTRILIHSTADTTLRGTSSGHTPSQDCLFRPQWSGSRRTIHFDHPHRMGRVQCYRLRSSGGPLGSFRERSEYILGSGFQAVLWLLALRHHGIVTLSCLLPVLPAFMYDHSSQ